MATETSTGPIREDPNDGYMTLAVTLTVAQLDKLKELAIRDHNGSVMVQALTDDRGLDWIEATTLRDDPAAPPMQIFYISPAGALRRDASTGERCG